MKRIFAGECKIIVICDPAYQLLTNILFYVQSVLQDELYFYHSFMGYLR